MSIGTTTQDLQRNPMQVSFIWAFSTGDSLDKGQISGRLYGEEKPVGALVWAYRLESGITPDPFTAPGDFITQIDENGNFNLQYLMQGQYRVFVLIDENKDFGYNGMVDRLAFPSRDVFAETSGTLPVIYFRAVKYDTIAPKLYNIDVLSRNNMLVNFSEEISDESVIPENFKLFDIETGESADSAIITMYKTGELGGSVMLYTDGLVPEKRYRMTIVDAADLLGNRLSDYSDTNSVFTAASRPDTTIFLINEIIPPDSAVDVPVNTSIKINFNSPVIKNNIENYFSLIDSSGNIIACSTGFASPIEFTMSPEDGFESQMAYRITVDYDSIFNLFGKTLQVNDDNNPDSLYTFITGGARSSSDLIGNVTINADSVEAPIIVEVTSLDGSAQGETQTIKTLKPGRFRFYGLDPGSYSLFAYYDIDGNGRWFPGGLRPYKLAEPFAIYGDEISIRAGIDNVLNTPLKIIIQ
jgi:hypothetical protein